VQAQERGASPPHAQRRLDLFAEIGAAEVVSNAAAKRRYTLRERGLAQYVWDAEVANWTGLPTNRPHKAANCEERRSF